MKRSTRLYFMAYGRLSVYKCVSKGLKPTYLTNHLAIAISKLRIQELFELAVNRKAFSLRKPDVDLFAELNGNFFKMLKSTEIDRYFNLETNSSDSQVNFEKF